MNKKTTHRINKVLEAIFSILSIIGALLVSNQIMIGWIVWIVASILGTVWGLRTKNHYVAMMNAFFTITNGMGIYNYLISPFLA